MSQLITFMDMINLATFWNELYILAYLIEICIYSISVPSFQ